MNKKIGMLRPIDKMQRKEKPWAYLKTNVDGGTILTKEGEVLDCTPGKELTETLANLSEYAVFCDGFRSLLAATDPTAWLVKQRRERHLEARHKKSNTRIVFLPQDIPPQDTLEAFTAFATYMEWLASLNVYPTARSGWSTLGRHLFLASLESPVRFFGMMANGRASLYGGRKNAPFPGRYRNVTKWDITAAYTSALGGYLMPRMLEAVRSDPICILSEETDGIAFAIVRVPEMPFPPLPLRADKHLVRLTKWKTGEICGWWAFAELRLAREVGCKVKIVSAFRGRLYHNDFAVWQSFIRAGRRLPNGAAGFAKHHGNVLWSSFSTTPSRILVKEYSADRKPTIIRITPPGMDFTLPTAYIASLIAASVRVRLHSETLMPHGITNERVVHCDTDGVISDKETPPIGEHGTRLGNWRKVKEIPLIEIKSPNAYRYTCFDCGDKHPAWHYSVSGTSNPDSLRRTFKDIAKARG